MKHSQPQIFLEDIRIMDATEAVNVSAVKIASGGATITFNSDAVTNAVMNGIFKPAGGLKRVGLTTGTGDVTLAAADSGKVYLGTKSSATQTYTLPLAATAGLEYTFICGHASGEILVTPQTGDNIQIKASEGGAVVTTATSTGIKNTAATNVIQDRMTLVSDGTTTWFAVSQSGIWASQ